MSSYTPKPVDTHDIELPEELLDLAEVLAHNVHEIWAHRRIDEGWEWGPERDDINKKTPCLIPYNRLPEHEKDYDRHTAMQTLKLILSLGYTIKRWCRHPTKSPLNHQL